MSNEITAPITIVQNSITAPITQARDAYQLAVADGFVGTLAQWLESLQGADGAAGPNSVTSATTSDSTANLSVATLTAQGATLYSDPDYGSITASAGTDGQPEFTVGSITLSESEGKVTAGFLEATDGLTIGSTSAQATGIALLGSETASAARTELGLGAGDNVTHATLITTENGTVSDPSVKIASHGFYQTGGNSLGLAIAGVQRYQFGNTSGSSGFRIVSNTGIRVGDTPDTSLSRISAGLWGVGSGALNSTDGDMQLRNLTASGTISGTSLSLTTPLPITSGGTGATDASAARTNLGSKAAGDALFTAETVADANGVLGINPLQLRIVDLRNMNNVSSGGSVSNQPTISFITLANSGASYTTLRTIGGIAGQAWNPGANDIGFNWSRPASFGVNLATQIAAPTGGNYIRFVLGKQFANPPAQLNKRGFGFEIVGTRIWLIVHNGTTLVTVDSNVDIVHATTSRIEALSDGLGNITLLHNGVQIATSAAGPSGNDTAQCNFWIDIAEGGTASTARYAVQSTIPFNLP